MNNIEEIKSEILNRASLAFLTESETKRLKKADSAVELLGVLKDNIHFVIRNGILDRDLINEFSSTTLSMLDMYFDSYVDLNVISHRDIVLLGKTRGIIQVSGTATIHCFHESSINVKSTASGMVHLSTHSKSITIAETTEKSMMKIVANENSVVNGGCWGSGIVSVTDLDDAKVNIKNSGLKSIVNDTVNKTIHVYSGAKIK